MDPKWVILANQEWWERKRRLQVGELARRFTNFVILSFPDRGISSNLTFVLNLFCFYRVSHTLLCLTILKGNTQISEISGELRNRKIELGQNF